MFIQRAGALNHVLGNPGINISQVIDGGTVSNSPGTTSLQAYWALEEASGNRADSFGSNTLAPTGVPGNATGKQGNCLHLVSASSQYLSIADNAALSMGSGVVVSIGCWVKLTTKTLTQVLVGKGAIAGITHEYDLIYDSVADRFVWEVQGNGSIIGFQSINADSLGSPSTGIWYFIAATCDFGSGFLNLQVNDGGVDSLSLDVSGGADGIRDGSAAFRIGATSTSLLFANADIDEVFLYKKILTAAQWTWVYNAGAGRAYSEF